VIIRKNAAEIEQMRAACERAAEVLARVVQWIRPGITTRELDEYAAEQIAELGAKSAFLGYHGYPGHICASINEEVVHGIPGDRMILMGDVVSIDVGVVYGGWIGDNARTVAVGTATPDIEMLLAATEGSLAAGIAQARAGNRVSDISHAVEEYVVARGFSVVREYVGHGVGRKMHEEPQIPNYGPAGRGPRLKPGMTLAIEPMVNMGTARVKTLDDKWTVVTADGLPSAHFENTIVVTDGEPEILTCPLKTPFE
jgi:methionyl aminopeptidase